MEFIIENWAYISGAAVPLYGLAWVIAKKTKTKKDDEILTLIGKIFRSVSNVAFPKTGPKVEKNKG